MASARQPYLSSRLQGFGTTIFAEMTQLALAHDAINLGQGFPDFDAPGFLKEAAIEAVQAGHNQYCRPYGVPALVEAIAEHQERFWGLNYDPLQEITVYNGATEAICACLQALCETGDEVVTFEPYYDSYRACLAMAGARERLVPLRGPEFEFSATDLEAAVTPKTRAILLNSPHNPTGKVFTLDELELIADLCRRHDLLAITDEVYEHLVFDTEHIPLASLPGMRERTVSISSAGKTFSVTGWKVGHTCAPAQISAALRTAHQFITFCNSAPFQVALAGGYRAPDPYFATYLEDYRRRRDLLVDGLREIGFGVCAPAGTYFVLTDIRPLGEEDGFRFCRELPERLGVAAIPAGAFYTDAAAGLPWVRWAFCKSEALIASAIERLRPLSVG